MFEIWWKDRLIDVVPTVEHVPDGLRVKSRATGPAERLPREEPDWRFSKVLAICLLAFTACVLIMTLTPAGEGGDEDGIFHQRLVSIFVPPPAPPKKLPAKVG